MPTISRSALVPYPPRDMYALVDDINAYPDFLPWCTQAAESHRDEDVVQATITLTKGSLNKAFTTRNRLQQGKMIEMRLVEGPFKHLDGFWRFDTLEDGQACKVSLDLDFEFSNRIVGMAIGPIFNQVANSLVDAFVARAREVYGAR